MNWLARYFDKKEEKLFLNHIKTAYDFDNAIIIHKNNYQFPAVVTAAALSMIEKDQDGNAGFNGMIAQTPENIKKFVLKFEAEGDYAILKVSRQYTSSNVSYYAVLLKNENGYYIPSRYISHYKMFKGFPDFTGINAAFNDVVYMRHCYVYNHAKNSRVLMTCYSFRFPTRLNGTLMNYKYTNTFVNNERQAFTRDLEVIVAINALNKTHKYTVTMSYNSLILKEEQYDDIPDFFVLLDDFLFPYNLTPELVTELNLELPMLFTPEYLKSMNKDFKLTVDMLKI